MSLFFECVILLARKSFFDKIESATLCKSVCNANNNVSCPFDYTAVAVSAKDGVW